MSLPDQIGRWMSLRAPQRESLSRLHAIAENTDFSKESLEAVVTAAVDQAHAPSMDFDTEFPSFCFALATGVGKTRLMGACIYDLWKTRGYRNFFILAPGSTIYEKLRAELQPSHRKYLFTGLSGFPAPVVWDGENYRQYRQMTLGEDQDRISVFVFNVGKIFNPSDKDETGKQQFKFHRFEETLGDGFSGILQRMGDLVVLMDESHRYRAPASLKAINNLKPVLGLEFTATPKFKGNILYSFSLGEAIGRFVKSPRVVTRTNLTATDQKVIDDLKLKDGIHLHEEKKARLAEFCDANGYPRVKPFVLVSTRDTGHAKDVREYLESAAFEEGAYRGKVIEIHSKPNSKEESDENIARLLEVESPSSNVEVVVHVTMLKEGWDVNNLYTIIPLRASVSEILTEQTIGRGLRLPLPLTESQVQELMRTDPEILRLSIVSHDRYEQILAARDARADLFRDPIRDLDKEEPEALTMVEVPTLFSQSTIDVLEGVVKAQGVSSSSELLTPERRAELIEAILARSVPATAPPVEAPLISEQGNLFPSAQEAAKPIDTEKIVKEMRDRIEKEVDALALQIDVPDIRIYAEPKLGLSEFQPHPSSDFATVEQRLRSADLKTGEQETGEILEAEQIDRPVAYLAALLLDEMDELGATEDKERVLQLAQDYLSSISDQERETVVYQYGDAMARDLARQVREHLFDETVITSEVRAGVVIFKPFRKSIRQKDGELDLREPPDRKSDIRRYLYGGIKKSVINRTGFDSDPEREFAVAIEDDGEVLKWVRPPLGQLPIHCRGQVYNIDFVVETESARYLIEVKARNELQSNDVSEKAKAAIQWCKSANDLQLGKPWHYRIIPDDSVRSTWTLAFMLGMSIRET